MQHIWVLNASTTLLPLCIYSMWRLDYPPSVPINGGLLLSFILPFHACHPLVITGLCLFDVHRSLPLFMPWFCDCDANVLFEITETRLVPALSVQQKEITGLQVEFFLFGSKLVNKNFSDYSGNLTTQWNPPTTLIKPKTSQRDEVLASLGMFQISLLPLPEAYCFIPLALHYFVERAPCGKIFGLAYEDAVPEHSSLRKEVHNLSQASRISSIVAVTFFG